jgi:hypothetical protein
MLSTTLDEMQRLNKKLNSSLLLESMLSIDWSKGSVTRYTQSKYIVGKHQVYRCWMQQGSSKIMLSSTQYEKLTGRGLNKDQIKRWEGV